MARVASLPVPVKSYAAVVTAFGNDQVRLGWFGGLTGVQARERAPGAHAIAQGAEDPKFKSFFIAHASTGIKRSRTFPAAIEGKTFTFGSKVSTSGRLMPEYFVRKHLGAEPDEVFERVGYSGDHSRTLALVQSGAYQTGAMNYKVCKRNKRPATSIPIRSRSSGSHRPTPITSGPSAVMLKRPGARASLRT